ncbi:MAG: aminoglycoside adenylyltransferase domain-containing protein [Gaiellaceae bacterium]
MAEPTAFPELNALLDDFVASLHEILGDNLHGAYLQGSFAVGDADEHSDVDFIVVTNDEVTDEQRAGLEAMHGRLFALETHWAQHLEGSYVPKTSLRRLDAMRRPFVYLDNGSTELTLDNHCNTHVVRWSLREHGVTLEGPDPQRLVDPVPPDGMRDELVATVGEYAAWAPAPTKAGGMSQWKQTFLVLTFCRTLHSLASGRVASKRASGEWAIASLDPQWRDLIQRALDDRNDPWGRVDRPAEPYLVERTLAFAEYAVREAA